MTTYSFCEAANTHNMGQWHIRRLTVQGKKLFGGADTPSLCGIKVEEDMKTEVNGHSVDHHCSDCAAVYRSEAKQATDRAQQAKV